MRISVPLVLTSKAFPTTVTEESAIINLRRFNLNASGPSTAFRRLLCWGFNAYQSVLLKVLQWSISKQSKNFRVSRSHQIPIISVISRKITKNCHSWISGFKQIVKSELTLMLDSLPVHTYLLPYQHVVLWTFLWMNSISSLDINHEKLRQKAYIINSRMLSRSLSFCAQPSSHNWDMASWKTLHHDGVNVVAYLLRPRRL